MEERGERRGPIFREIRRYYCEFCGICRSKKSLVTSHIHSHHQHKQDSDECKLMETTLKEEIKEKRVEEKGKEEGVKYNTCEECGASFHKPAYLKQHMQSHSLERAFTCPVEDCSSSYRRKDHLTRHLLQHQGKIFKCTVENCNHEFAFQGNMKRHVRELHDMGSTSVATEREKRFICQEIGCGKVFKYASKFQKHEDSHVKLDTVEAVCSESGCMKHFINEQCLKAHLLSCHQHIICAICGTKQLKKNIKRHLRTHEAGYPVERIKCEFKGCLYTFSNKSNLHQHLKAVHLGLRPFSCRITGCGRKFPFRHVRDNHEKTSLHAYTHGHFVESDERFRLRPRGGRKRKCPAIESLLRKRVTPPSQSNIFSD